MTARQNIITPASSARQDTPHSEPAGSLTNRVRHYLQQHHYYWTEPRAAVLRELQHSPASLPELSQKLHQTLDQATVYRTIALFEELGIAHRILTGTQPVVELADQFSPHHHHLVCEKCGNITDFEDSGLEQNLSRLARTKGFAADRHHLELFGLCRDCQLHTKL